MLHIVTWSTEATLTLRGENKSQAKHSLTNSSVKVPKSLSDTASATIEPENKESEESKLMALECCST